MINDQFNSQKKNSIIENIQEFYSEILEYYDELFPVNEDALSLIKSLTDQIRKKSPLQPAPLSRYLGIGCATGSFENKVDSLNLEITGIDKNPLMIETAMRRMKGCGTTSRFFEMSIIDIGRFLQQDSFNIITCIENTLPYISDPTLLKKFFHDTKKLLAPDGCLLIQTVNFDSFDCTQPITLPERSSIRVCLKRSYIPRENNLLSLKAELELGNGNKIILPPTTPILPITISLLTELGSEAGFTPPQFYGDFTLSPWTIQSPMTIAVF